MASTQPPERLALVVDDDPEVLSATALFALREGFSVLTAKDGKAGIDAYRRNGSAVTVTIIDLMMPVCCGDEAIREIRGLDPAALIILSTATPIGDARRRVGNVPGVVVLQKPFTGREFRAALANVLGPSGA